MNINDLIDMIKEPVAEEIDQPEPAKIKKVLVGGWYDMMAIKHCNDMDYVYYKVFGSNTEYGPVPAKSLKNHNRVEKPTHIKIYFYEDGTWP